MIGTLSRCVLFDLDGTIVDSLPGIEFSIREAFAACKVPLLARNLRELIGPPIRNILSRAGDVLENTQLDALEKSFRASYDAGGWRKAVCYPKADVVLRTLRERGHRLFVVSNKPRWCSLQILEREQILSCFEAVITRDSRSPHYLTKEEMIGALLSQKVHPQDCMMVGDTIEDARAALKTGIQFVMMTHGYGDLSKISSIRIAHTLDSFSQFYELMTKEPVLD
jgi:phosphoglycolate phosphatase